MEGARQYLKMVTEFGLNVTDLSRRCPDTGNVWTEAERRLNTALDTARYEGRGGRREGGKEGGGCLGLLQFTA